MRKDIFETGDMAEVARFSVSYRDLNDMQHKEGPYSLSVEAAER